jgi:hypothetical protein
MARCGLSVDSGCAAVSCWRSGSLCCVIRVRSVSDSQLLPTRSAIPLTNSGDHTAGGGPLREVPPGRG